MDQIIRTRPGTHDAAILQGVTVGNEYQLPDAFGPDDLIIDVGAHIGGFSLAALGRGAGRVVAFEAEPANYRLASENLRPYGDRVTLHPRAVWRSDWPAGCLRFFHSPNGANTGGGGLVFWADDPARSAEVETVPFDAALRAATRGGRYRVRLLKLDCEGSEFPILLTSRRLNLVDAIVGEFHEAGGPYDDHPIPEAARIAGHDRFTITGLAAVLERAGFSVAWTRSGNSHLGFFSARRFRPPDRGLAGWLARGLSAGLLRRPSKGGNLPREAVGVSRSASSRRRTLTEQGEYQVDLD